MNNKMIKLSEFWTLTVFLLVITTLLGGCAPKIVSKQTDRNMEKQTVEGKLICGINAFQDSESIRINIKGNRPLIYTSVKQPLPLGVILYFPDTGFDNVKPTVPLDNDIISSINTIKFTEKGNTARIEILLKKDVSYDVARKGTDLEISFKKNFMASASAAPDLKNSKTSEALPPGTQPDLQLEAQYKQPGKQPDMAMHAEKNVRTATLLNSVSSTSIDKKSIITVNADGKIKDYKVFTIKNPPRIVFDLPGLTSPYKKEQSIPVNTGWIKKIRHFGYPDRIRLVIDTNKEYLYSYSVSSVENGLEIQVGTGVTVSKGNDKKQLSASNSKSFSKEGATETFAGRTKPASVNRIDFLSEDAGKSTVIIGTTKPVKFDLKKGTDKNLNLRLYDTTLPDYRKRPLITTRFKSAVDCIRAVHPPDINKDTMILIDLRETVPYLVEQTDSLLLIHFEASSIPPRTFEEAKLPYWKKIMAQPLSGTAETEATEVKGQKKAGAETKETAKPEKIGDEFSVLKSSKKYTGEKIALDFYETDVKNVFRILRTVSGKNFAIGDDVTGKVTMTLDEPVPWDQVLDLVLKMNKLGMVFEGDIIRVATLETLKKEEELRRDKLAAERQAKEQQIALEPLITEYIIVNYANAKSDVLPHLEKIRTLDRVGQNIRGSLSVDDRTNLIIMTDVADRIKKARQVVKRLDRVTPQVIIEARIVEASTNFSKEIGTEWGAMGGVQEGDDDAGTGPQRGYDTVGGTYGYGASVNLPTTVSAGTIGFNFIRLAGTRLLLNAKLMAMEAEGKGKIISAPKVVTLDNKTAKIKQGLSYPYNKLDDSGNTTTVFKDVDLILEVTPHVTLDNRIALIIEVKKNDLGSMINNRQSFITKEATTELLVDNGDTVVIGGIIKTTERSGESGLPWLKKIPVAKWLFKSTTESKVKEELLIFITPTIVQLKQRDNTL